jgi:hypothetical protein
VAENIWKRLRQSHFPSVKRELCIRAGCTNILTKEALNVGTDTCSYEIFCDDITVIAPGGKLVTTCDAHIIPARTNKTGVARRADGLKKTNKFDLMLKSSSIVDTFIVWIRRRYHRYWTNATANAPRMLKPNKFARMFEAVDI